MTFVGPDDGWVLGTGACAASCVSIYRTTDGGALWTRIGAPPAIYPSTGCYGLSTACVDALVFATTERGFAFGRNFGATFVTTDGGAAWTRLRVSDTSALALAGNVALSLREDGGCGAGECQVERSLDGGGLWSLAGQPLVTPEGGDGNVLLEPDGYAYAIGFGNPAGGGPETAVLDRSVTFGAAWNFANDPCSDSILGGSIALGATAAPNGVLTFSCLATRADIDAGFVIVSLNGGRTFGPHRAAPPASDGLVMAAGSAQVLAMTTATGLSVSHNGGLTWFATYVCPVRNEGDQGIAAMTFQTPMVAHLICGNSMARSTDGGLHWTTYRFS